MKHLSVNKLATACASALLTGGMLLHISPAIAATAAGTQIKNLATVTYEDTNGNQYSAQSNEAIITVKQVYSAELGSDTTKLAAAGQTVYIQNTLTNTGNGADQYTLAATNDNSLTGDDIDATGIKVYIDSNGNGLVDSGETEITGSITVLAGQSLSIVTAVPVPNTAMAGEELGVKLTATGNSAGAIVDVPPAVAILGADTVGGTNQTLITVSTDAVVNLTKSALLTIVSPTEHQITYTLRATNTGNAPATDVKFYDAVPVGTTYVAGSAKTDGLIASGNGDTTPLMKTAVSESTEGVDINHDNDTGDVFAEAIYALDKTLDAGQTASISFTVKYDPTTFNNDTIPGSAGDDIKNIAVVNADPDGPGSKTPITTPSNPTLTEVPQSYATNINDTGGDAAVTKPDDDSTDDTKQYIASAAPGSTVLFNLNVTNNGTGPDTFELSVANTDFPAGTVFTFWNADGTVQLVDTNSKGSIDTGMLDAGESTTIMVKAQLPAGQSGSDLSAVVTATSAGDPTSKSTIGLELGNVAVPGVDLYDDATKKGTIGTNEDDLGDQSNLNKGTSPGTRDVLAGTVGGKVNIPFYIDNDSGSSDSFQLSAGSTWNNTTSTLGALPDGWTVLFYKGDGTGKPTGTPISSTELLPAGAQAKEYVAVISIPADASKALADYPAGFDATTADGDGDQPIYIRINSANTSASDIMLDAIDVSDKRALELTPPGSNQIQPGGSVDYTHRLENTGNTEELIELSATNSLSGDGWNNNVLVDTDGNGTPDKPLSQLNPGDTISAKMPDGSIVPVTVADADNDGNIEITVPAGAKIDLVPTVYAPSDAAPGTVDVLTITAEPVTVSGTTVTPDTSTDAPKVSLTDTTTIQLGQVRLDKSVAIDANCDGTPEGTAGQEFEANLSAQVAPNQCAIWQIKVENQGDAPAQNVVVRDKVPAFSSYQDPSMQYCLGMGCAPAPITTEGVFVDPNITFYVGSSPDITNGKGGTLAPGEQATVRFSTKVQ